MIRTLAFLMIFLSVQMQALEYEKQFENDQITIEKIKIAPHEELGAHRDEHPQMVIALKGGTITRLEADGRKVDVEFPTGETIYRKADLENELHRSVNNSNEPVELVIIKLKNNPLIFANVDAKSHEILINIKLSCPMSEELKDYAKSIPPAGNYSSSYDEWKSSFVGNMNQLIKLVESKKVYNSFWSAKTDEALAAEVKK